MPELPEVETIRKIIEPQITDLKIMNVTINNAQIIAHPDENKFVQKLTGQTVSNMTRRGKFLTIHFESGDRMVIHLKMTGQLLVTPADFPDEKHTHFIAELSDSNQIRYIDVRRFGRFWYFEKGEIDTVTGQDKLGIEPFDKSLTASYLKAKLCTRKKAIKEMLHDQSIVAGIGSIYSDEILFEAGIYPDCKCNELDNSDFERLAEKIPEIIKWGIESDKMTAEEYLAGKGKEYSNIPDLRVYNRGGELCRICNSTIEKIKIGGRGSCYCPKCQRKRK